MPLINDDCILACVQELTLKEKISFGTACDHFADLLRPQWHRQYRTLDIVFNHQTSELETINEESLELSHAELAGLIKIVSPLVETVRLKNLETVTVKLFTSSFFPRTSYLRFTQEVPYYLTNRDLVELSVAFPNLHTLIPHGNFNGKLFLLWTQLQHLSLVQCPTIKFSQVSQILRECNLKTLKLGVFYEVKPMPPTCANFFNLERLLLNSRELALLLSEDLRRFRNLRWLMVIDSNCAANINRFCTILGKHKRNELYAVRNINLNKEFPIPALLNFGDNLLELSFSYNSKAISEIVEYIPHLRSVKKLGFYGCYVRNMGHINSLLKACTHIDAVEFEGCRFRFPSFPIKVQDVVAGRKTPLLFTFTCNTFFNCTTFRLDPVEPEYIGQSDLFATSTKRNSLIINRRLLFLFKPRSELN